MKAIIRSLIVCGFLVLSGSLLAQIFATNTSGKVFTNAIGPAQASRVASHLRLDMREEDAKKLLDQSGLGFSLSVGDSFGWVDSFPLTNGGSLRLDIKPKIFRADGAWKDGLLKAAFIQSNGTNIASIIITNAP